MLRTIKKLGKLSAIYTIGDLVTRGVALLLLPLYTKYLSTEDYGILAIVNMVNVILIAIMPLGMTSVVYRFHHQFDTDEQRTKFYGAVSTFLFIFVSIIASLLLIFGRPLFELIFTQTPFAPYIQIAIIMAFLNSVFIIMPSQMLRVNQQALSYVAFRFLQFFGTVGFTILLVVYLGYGVRGAVFAQLIGICITSITTGIYLLRHIKLNLNWRLIKPALSYSIPLIPHFVSHWILNASDRAILERNVSLNDVGVYSLGYQAGSVIQMLVAASNAAFIPLYSKSAKDKSILDRIPRLGTYYVLIIATVAILFVSLADTLITLVTPNEYHGANIIIPWVVLACVAQSVYYLGVNVLGPIDGNSKPIPTVTMLGAAVNIVINILLVPRYGIVMAAMSTTVSYVFLAIAINLIARRSGSVVYEYDRISKIFIATSVAIAVKLYFTMFVSGNYILSAVAAVATFMCLIMVSGMFRIEELSRVQTILISSKSKLFNQNK